MNSSVLDLKRDLQQEDPALIQETDAWIHGEMSKIAASMRRKTLPMQHPDASFYEIGYTILYNQGIRGQDLLHAVHRILQELFFRTTTGDPGVIYNYPEYYKEKKVSFDYFFSYLFRQKSINLYRRKFYPKNRTTQAPIVEERAIEDPTPGWEGMSKDQLRKIVYRTIPAFLANQRGGRFLVRIWQLWLEGVGLTEIADLLNREGIKGPNERSLWHPATVHRYREQIINMVRDYLGSRGLSFEDFRNLEIGG